MSGEPCGRAGEPEQNAHRGTQSSQRLVLPQIRVATEGLPPVPMYRDLARSHPNPLFYYFCFLFKKKTTKKLLRNLLSDSPGIYKNNKNSKSRVSNLKLCSHQFARKG